MNPALFNIALRPMLQSPWREVAQLYRQACWHSSQARDAEARRILEGDFAEALIRANAVVPMEEAPLQRALEAEADRVALAAAVLEQIDWGAPAISAPDRSPEMVRSGPLKSVRSAAAAPLGIADFIEDMLVQERDPR